jgi:Tfp pilus assembly protein PilE
MDRLKLFKGKIQASSLVEVITALVIISVIFSIAIMVYLNVHRSGFSSRRLVGALLINEVLVNTLQEKRYQQVTITIDDFTIYQDIVSYKSASNLKVIILEARDVNGKLVAERKRLVYAQD